MKFKRENTFPVLLQKYFDIYLPISRGMSKNTIKSYRSALRAMFQYLEDVRGIPQEKVDFHILDRENLFGYINWLVSDKGCSISTRNHHLSALISFAEYAREADYDSAWGFRNLAVKIPFKYFKRKERAFFSKREVEILLSLPDQSTKLGYRNYVLLSLMYASGMTVKETCNLKFKHVRNVLNHLDYWDPNYRDSKLQLESSPVFRRVWIEIPDGNGGGRNIPISKDVSRIIKEYIVSKNREYMNSGYTIRGYRSEDIGEKSDERYFFTTRSSKQMTTSCVEGIFKKYLYEAEALYPELFKGKKYSPYTMRHTTAMHLKEMGVKLDSLMMFLGHKSIHSTEVYYRKLSRTFHPYYDNSNFEHINASEGDSSGVGNGLMNKNALQDKNILQEKNILKVEDGFQDKKAIDTWNKILLVGDIVDFR